MKAFKTGIIRKYLFLFSLALLPLMTKGQIKLPQSMSPGGTFGLVDVNELKGGLMMVDNMGERDSIFMNRTKRGLMVVVLDADDILAGDQTKTFMFIPSEDPADYADAGKIWNTYDEYSVHLVEDFIAKYSLNPWVEVSLGLKDPDGPGIDTIFISTSFIDTIFSNTGDTLFLMDKVKTDSLYADYLNLSGVQILGISTDETFANASNDSIVTQLAIKNYVQTELSSLTSNANITNLTVDTLTADTAFISSVLNNVIVSDSINVDTLIAVYSTIDTASINKVAVNYFTLNGYWVASISNDTTFTSADSMALITEFAVQNRIDSIITYVNNEFSNLSQNSIENPLNSTSRIVVNENDSLVFTVNGDTAIVVRPDGTVETDTLVVQQLTLSGSKITGLSTDKNLGGTSSSNDSLSTQLAVKTYVDDRFTDFGSTANITNLTVDTLTADTAFISNLLNNILVSDSINVDTLIAVYSTIDTASINMVAVNYFTLNGYWVASISNDTTFTSADSMALITEFAVQNRIDSVITYVNNEFSNLSQNSIENPLNSTSRIVVNENDSLVFTVNGDTAMVVRPDGTVETDTLMVQQLTLSGDTIQGISTDVNLGGLASSNDSISTQLAVKTYVDAEIAKLSGATTTDTLVANVAYIDQGNIDTLIADTAYISELVVDSITADIIRPDSLIMDGDTIVAVAASSDVVPDTALDKTVVTAGYVKNNASAFPEGLNPVTRAGWTGVSGQDLNADNVVDFLKKVFFPVPEPQISDFNINGSGIYHSFETAPGGDPNGALTETISGTYAVPYAIWKNSGFSLTLNYDIDNRSSVDANITTTNIATVGLTASAGSVNQTDNINNANPNITGSFTVNKADFGAPSVTSNNNYTFTLTVTDDYPNVNTLTIPVQLSDATQLTVNWFRINGGNGPITVEGDGTDKSPVFTWSINSQEDTITAITLVQELPSATTYSTGSTSTTGTFNHSITAPVTQGTTTYRFDLRVGSEIFGSNVQTNNNRTYIITDRHFWGYVYLAQKTTINGLANDALVDLSTFFPDAPSAGDQLNKDWEGGQPDAGNATGASSSDGIGFSTSTGGDVYACIAIPRTSGAVELHQWDDLNKFWVNQTGMVSKPITYTVGSLTKDYWIVYSTTAFSSTAAPIFRVVEK